MVHAFALEMHGILLSVLRNIAGSPSCSRVLRRRTTTSFHTGYLVRGLSRFVPCPHVTHAGREKKSTPGLNSRTVLQLPSYPPVLWRNHQIQHTTPATRSTKTTPAPVTLIRTTANATVTVPQNRQGSLDCCHNFVRDRHCVLTTTLH